MKHVTNKAFTSYKEAWQSIFKDTYRDKYTHESGLSGGGGDYPFYDIHISKSVTLIPEHRFDLSSSLEYFTVPEDFYLRTGNKSTWARMGIDASFNTYIDNGFKGFLTIEIINYQNKTVIIEAGTPILKVELVPCFLPCKPYDGKYQNQPNRPVGPILNH